MTYAEAWRSHDGNVSFKWSDYLEHYDEQIVRHLSGPVDFLEIGVQNGGDLQVWQKVLPKGSSVLGIDIDQRCASLGLPVLIGSAADGGWLETVLGNRRFDIIIDDGSHFCNEVRASFGLLWSRVKPGGWYVVEDLHTSYWSSHGGGLNRPDSSIEELKTLIDDLNLQHVTTSVVPSVRSVFFADSVCIIRKYAGEPLNHEIKTGSYGPIHNI